MCLSGFRLLGLSPSAVRRSGCYFGPHTTFSGSLFSLAALATLLNAPTLAQQKQGKLVGPELAILSVFALAGAAGDGISGIAAKAIVRLR